MKTKTFFGLCFIICMAVTGLSAQSNQKSGNEKTYVYKDLDLGYWSPVYCDGNMVDVLTGTIKVQYLTHIQNGVVKWEILVWDGEVTSELNQEVFQVHESDKIGIPDAGVYTYHFNLVGNMGSHYINSGTLNMDDWTIVVDKSVCPGH